MSTAEVFTAALALSARTRAELIGALIASLDDGTAPPFANATRAELKRRHEKTPRRSHDAVMARARASLHHTSRRPSSARAAARRRRAH